MIEKMKKQNYISPVIKVHAPKFLLLDSIGVGASPDNPDAPIDSKSNTFFDDSENQSWGRVWGGADD